MAGDSEQANADLRRDNRRRWKTSLGLIIFGLLLIIVLAKVKLPSAVKGIGTIFAFLVFVVGVFILHWANQEAMLLRGSGPKDRPKL